MSKGKLLVISGFSGVGKGTVIGRIMEQDPGAYAFSVSATTRTPREGELNGREYFFITADEFEAGIEAGKFLEYTRYQDHYYGTPLEPILKRLERGENIILDIEVEGAMNVKKAYPEAVTVFLMPVSAEILYRRLAGRGTETEEQIFGRLRRSAEEAGIVTGYDNYLVNDVLQDTVDQVVGLLTVPQNEEEREAGLAHLTKVRAELIQLLSEKEII